MANQNLSQFGEKLFVADADHTFIWDSAVSISKRVSRNSWLNSGTLTSDAPVTISQTWDQIGTTFTAFKVNAVSTASASGSLLLDLQVGGVTKFKVDKTGSLNIANGSFLLRDNVSGANEIRFLDNGLLFRNASETPVIRVTSGGLHVRVDGVIGFGSPLSVTPETTLAQDAANTLALRNGETNQKFHVYATYSNASNYRRCVLGSFDGANFDIQTEGLGTGAAGGALNFGTAGARRMTITTAGNVGIGTTSPTSKLHVALNPAANYTTEKVQFGNVFFGNAVSNYSALWMGGISPALTLTNSNFVLASDGSGTILNSPAGSGITFQVNGTDRWAINTSGHFLAAADNTYDIGASGANRPRNVYVAGAVLSGGMQLAPGGAIQNTAGTGAYFNITSGASRLRFDLGGGVVWNDNVNNPLGTETVGLMRNATGVLEVNSGTLGAFRDVRCRSVIQQLPITTTITPASNGDLVVEATSNTTLTFKLKGTDGTVRTGTITLA